MLIAPTPTRAPIVPGFDYSPSIESTRPKIRDRYNLFIGGEWVAPHSGETFPTINPATEEKIADISFADAKDVARAVEAARHAYDKYWRKLKPSERAKYI